MSGYLESFLAQYAPERAPAELTKPTEGASVSSVSPPPPRSGARRQPATAVQEVLGFPANLLAELPLASTLAVGPARRVIRVPSAEWSELIAAAARPARATVREVLAARGLELLAVAIDGGAA